MGGEEKNWGWDLIAVRKFSRKKTKEVGGKVVLDGRRSRCKRSITYDVIVHLGFVEDVNSKFAMRELKCVHEVYL